MHSQLYKNIHKNSNKPINLDNTLSKHPTYYLKKLYTPLPLPGIEKLNIELLNLYKKLLPQPEEQLIRKELVSKITKFIKSVLPEYDVHTFGSTKANTFLPNSDIDIVLIRSDSKHSLQKTSEQSLVSQKEPSSAKNTEADNISNTELFVNMPKTKKFKPSTDKNEPVPNKVLNNLANKIFNAAFLDQSYILHIKQARVPILKLRDKVYGIEFDIVVSKANSLKQASFTCLEIENKPYLKAMMLLLKYFLKSRALNDSRFGGLCSYAQFLMLLSFAQLHPVLQNKNLNPTKNLGVLFLDFFQFYGFDFQYETVTISVNDVCYYKKTMSNSIISIEDPVDVNHDVGDNCIQMYSIKDVFQHAYKIMTILLRDRIEAKESLMCVWMNLDENQEKWRKSIVDKYRKSKDIK